MRLVRIRLLVAGCLAAVVGTATAGPERAAGSQTVEVLAYGFAGIDERDLGAMFRADLGRVDGAANYFVTPKAKRVPRREVDMHVLRASEANEIDVGVQFLFIGLDVKQSESHDAVVIHSREVTEVIRVDESTDRSKAEVPQDAVFYLAEVHLGTTVDLTIEGDYASTGARLSVPYAQGNISAQDVQSKTSATVKLHGLGVTDVTGQGAFSTSLADLRRNFRSNPAPIELVFKTLPGRTFEAPKRAERVVDELALKLSDGRSRAWQLPPGKYRIAGMSAPNGLATSWSGIAECDQPTLQEVRRLDTTCLVRTPATLAVQNPRVAHDIADELTSGPDETMTVVIARLPERVEIADADTQKLVGLFDLVVATVQGDGGNCKKIADDINRLVDLNGEVIDLGRGANKRPKWLTAHISTGIAAMTPNLEKCASNAALKAAFDRFSRK